MLSSQKIAEAALKKATDSLRIGISEIDVCNVILKEFKRQKEKSLPFPPIVAFGKGTADIHHKSRNTKLKEGDTIMIDLGATFGGYCSDMTRTYFYGTPSKKQREIYSSVLKAQQKILDAVKKGERRCGYLDKLAHTSLKRHGAKAFPHTLGHGVGTVIHEWPILRSTSSDILKPGTVVTVEPGVYLKNWGGVRIEDMILITSSGYRNLTSVSKDLKDIILNN